MASEMEEEKQYSHELQIVHHGTQSSSLVLGQGENWLRLVERNQVLQDSQEAGPYPSMVSLAEVGTLEAPTDDCFLCLDVDESLCTIKDMRPPSSSPPTQEPFQVWLSRNGREKVLKRRGMRQLQRGDRLVTKSGHAIGLVLEYHCNSVVAAAAAARNEETIALDENVASVQQQEKHKSGFSFRIAQPPQQPPPPADEDDSSSEEQETQFFPGPSNLATQEGEATDSSDDDVAMKRAAAPSPGISDKTTDNEEDDVMNQPTQFVGGGLENIRETSDNDASTQSEQEAPKESDGLNGETEPLFDPSQTQGDLFDPSQANESDEKEHKSVPAKDVITQQPEPADASQESEIVIESPEAPVEKENVNDEREEETQLEQNRESRRSSVSRTTDASEVLVVDDDEASNVSESLLSPDKPSQGRPSETSGAKDVAAKQSEANEDEARPVAKQDQDAMSDSSSTTVAEEEDEGVSAKDDDKKETAAVSTRETNEDKALTAETRESNGVNESRKGGLRFTFQRRKEPIEAVNNEASDSSSATTEADNEEVTAVQEEESVIQEESNKEVGRPVFTYNVRPTNAPAQTSTDAEPVNQANHEESAIDAESMADIPEDTTVRASTDAVADSSLVRKVDDTTDAVAESKSDSSEKKADATTEGGGTEETLQISNKIQAMPPAEDAASDSSSITEVDEEISRPKKASKESEPKADLASKEDASHASSISEPNEMSPRRGLVTVSNEKDESAMTAPAQSKPRESDADQADASKVDEAAGQSGDKGGANSAESVEQSGDLPVTQPSPPEAGDHKSSQASGAAPSDQAVSIPNDKVDASSASHEPASAQGEDDGAVAEAAAEAKQPANSPDGKDAGDGPPQTKKKRRTRAHSSPQETPAESAGTKAAPEATSAQSATSGSASTKPPRSRTKRKTRARSTSQDVEAEQDEAKTPARKKRQTRGRASSQDAEDAKQAMETPVRKTPARHAKTETSGSYSTRKSTRKRARNETEAPLRVLITGEDVTEKHKKMLRKIGAELVETTEDAHTADVVIAGHANAPYMKRTPKLMIAICRTRQIVKMTWLEKSYKEGEAVSYNAHHILNDKKAEKKYKFSMRESMKAGEEMREKGRFLLSGYSVYVCDGVAGNEAPPKDELKLIVSAADGKWLTSLSSIDGMDASNVLIITKKGKQGKKKKPTKEEMDVEEAVVLGAKAHPASWLFKCIMRQELSDD